MKTLKLLALSLSLLSFSAAAHAGEAKVLFTSVNASLLSGGVLKVKILDNGDLIAKRTGRDEAGNEVVKFKGLFARWDERGLETVKEEIAQVKPEMKLRTLTREEEARNKMCASDSAITYRVGETQIVAQNHGCIMVGLADKKAARAVKTLMNVVNDAVADQSDVIYGRQ